MRLRAGQASALLAENAVYPMLVVGTLTAHIHNFVKEFEEYLTVRLQEGPPGPLYTQQEYCTFLIRCRGRERCNAHAKDVCRH